MQSSARDLLRVVRIRLPNDLGWELVQIARRGVDITFLFADGEPGLELLRMQGGMDLEKLGERCRIQTIDGADHTFSHSTSRVVLEQALSEALLTQRPPHPAT